jgi:hypothetical protein
VKKLTQYKTKCKGIDVPSDDEVEALSAMKALKLRVREIKKKMSNISSTGKEGETQTLLAFEQDLVRLKKEWDRWEEKRRKAARRRMVLLGHEKPE